MSNIAELAGRSRFHPRSTFGLFSILQQYPVLRFFYTITIKGKALEGVTSGRFWMCCCWITKRNLSSQLRDYCVSSCFLGRTDTIKKCCRRASLLTTELLSLESVVKSIYQISLRIVFSKGSSTKLWRIEEGQRWELARNLN